MCLNFANEPGIPIDIHFEDLWITVTIGAGTKNEKKSRFYPQDLFRVFSQTDEIYNVILKDIEEYQKQMG